jgi:hypothetical protein
MREVALTVVRHRSMIGPLELAAPRVFAIILKSAMDLTANHKDFVREHSKSKADRYRALKILQGLRG